MEQRIILSFLSTLQEKSEKPINPVCEELEEEMERFMSNLTEKKGVFPPLTRLGFRAIARHFAQWQKEKDAELIEIAYNDGITIGKTKQKEQMMEGAVEGKVSYYADVHYVITNESQLSARLKQFQDGDKVKIIIFKEEKQ